MIGCIDPGHQRARLRAHVSARHNISEQDAARRVIETGEPLLIPKLDYEQLRGCAPSRTSSRLTRRLAFTAR